MKAKQKETFFGSKVREAATAHGFGGALSPFVTFACGCIWQGGVKEVRQVCMKHLIVQAKAAGTYDPRPSWVKEREDAK